MAVNITIICDNNKHHKIRDGNGVVCANCYNDISDKLRDARNKITELKKIIEELKVATGAPGKEDKMANTETLEKDALMSLIISKDDEIEKLERKYNLLLDILADIQIALTKLEGREKQ